MTACTPASAESGTGPSPSVARAGSMPCNSCSLPTYSSSIASSTVGDPATRSMTKNGCPRTAGSGSIQRTGGAGKPASDTARITRASGSPSVPNIPPLLDPHDEILSPIAGRDRRAQHPARMAADHDGDLEPVDVTPHRAGEPLTQPRRFRSRDDVGLSRGGVMPGERLQQWRGGSRHPRRDGAVGPHAARVRRRRQERKMRP